MSNRQWLVDFLVGLHIPRSDAEAVSQVTQIPHEALELLGRKADGTVYMTRKDVTEWYSEAQQKYYYAVKNKNASLTLPSSTTTTSWTPPACFAYSEWILDSQLYQIPLLSARDVYLGLDAFLQQHSPNRSWPAITTLSKILGNIAACGNTEEKYRSIRLNNEKFNKTVCFVHGALDVLLFTGFQLVGEQVLFPENSPLGVLKAAAARAARLVEKKGHSGEARMDKRSSGSGEGASLQQPLQEQQQQQQQRPPSPFYGAPGFLHQERIYHCNVCNHPINDGSERLFTGRHDAPVGEYRYECSTCLFEATQRAPSSGASLPSSDNSTNFNLCQGCWDRMQNTGAVLHVTGHIFQHIGPRMSRHNDYYGTRGGNGNGGGGGGGGGTDRNPWGMVNRGAYPQRALNRLYGNNPR